MKNQPVYRQTTLPPTNKVGQNASTAIINPLADVVITFVDTPIAGSVAIANLTGKGTESQIE